MYQLVALCWLVWLAGFPYGLDSQLAWNDQIEQKQLILEWLEDALAVGLEVTD